MACTIKHILQAILQLANLCKNQKAELRKQLYAFLYLGMYLNTWGSGLELVQLKGCPTFLQLVGLKSLSKHSLQYNTSSFHAHRLLSFPGCSRKAVSKAHHAQGTCECVYGAGRSNIWWMQQLALEDSCHRHPINWLSTVEQKRNRSH